MTRYAPPPPQHPLFVAFSLHPRSPPFVPPPLPPPIPAYNPLYPHSPQDKEALNHILKKRQKKVARKFPEHMNLPEAGSCLGLASWYEHCEPDCKMQLNGLVKVMHFKANVGESFLKEVSKTLGRPADSKSWQCPGLFVIVTGVVQLRLGRKMYNLGAGFTLGLQSMICDQSKGAERFSEVFAETDCTVCDLTTFFFLLFRVSTNTNDT